MFFSLHLFRTINLAHLFLKLYDILDRIYLKDYIKDSLYIYKLSLKSENKLVLKE